MAMPGRSFSAGSQYRYGFNGKENDRDINAGAQDYGMRISDVRLGRFLSVDPLTGKYPELTPYQFASNMPISGVDLDGKEYLTAIYNVTISKGQQTVTAKYLWFDAEFHNFHGNEGIGVDYDVKINNLDKGTSIQKKYFVSRGGNSKVGGITQYGNYMGSAPLPNIDVNSGSPIKNTYRYDVEAINFVDQQAKLHDLGYDRVNSTGASGLFSDWGTTPYDQAALTSWNEFYNNNKNHIGSEDPFNHQSVGMDELAAAGRGKDLFNIVVDIKKTAISTFMQLNYTNSAKKTMKTPYTKNPENIEFNYQLFLQKYMKKDEHGEWTRRTEMWDNNKNEGFTPKIPTK